METRNFIEQKNAVNMFKIKIKLIILLAILHKYCFEIINVSGNDSPVDEKPKEEGDDLPSQVWSDQWREQPKWQTQPEEHAQPLKREEAPADLPTGSELTGLNLSDPITKFHCPLNLLYGNNLTVKNYFLVVPKGSEAPNEVIKKFEVASEERSVMIGANPAPQKAEGQSVMIGTVDGAASTASIASSGGSDNASDGSTATGTVSSSDRLDSTATGTVSFSDRLDSTATGTVSSSDSLDSSKVSDTASTTVPADITMTFIGNMENRTMEGMVELFTSQATQAPTPAASGSANDDLMRTIDKYCETFNLSDQSTYTINPVSINTDVNVAAEDKNKQSLVEQTKHKRTPQCEDCVKLNISGDVTYTINPVAIPVDGARLVKPSVVNFKKQKRNLTSRRPRKIKRSKNKSFR